MKGCLKLWLGGVVDVGKFEAADVSKFVIGKELKVVVVSRVVSGNAKPSKAAG